MILKNEMSTSQDCKPKIVSSLSYDYISQDCDLMTHFVGLTPKQFEVLYGFLNDMSIGENKLLELQSSTIFFWNFNYSTVYSSGSFSNFEPGITSSSVRIVKD